MFHYAPNRMVTFIRIRLWMFVHFFPTGIRRRCWFDSGSLSPPPLPALENTELIDAVIRSSQAG